MRIDSSSTNRRVHLLLLATVALPALIGYPLNVWKLQIVPGVSWSAVLYLALMHILLPIIIGRRIYANLLAASAMITLPVVFTGAGLSTLTACFTGGSPTAFGGHYLRLCVTMLTVVPLALAIIALIPFAEFERRRLLDPRGVSRGEKKLLMALRVFHHIAFFVMPTALEVLREELAGQEGLPTMQRVGNARRTLIHLAVASICSALQPIGLWAYEIAQMSEPDTASVRRVKID
jgi:hypothetical protein